LLKINKKIAVIGDGGWGTTLAILLNKKGFKVELWGVFPDYLKILDKERKNPKFLPGVKIPQEIIFTSDIKKALTDCHLIILAVPSQYMRGVVQKIKGISLNEAIILSVTKGIEHKNLKRMSEVIKEELGPVKLAVLSGPSIAPEVARGIPTSVVTASVDLKIAQEVQVIFSTAHFRVYTSDDIIGVELGGSLKNIMAISAGISDGLGFGTNTKSALLTRGIVEITRLGVALGAQKETFMGLSGIGDLMTTAFNSKSRNHFVGEQIGRGKKLDEILENMEMVAEGIETIKSVKELAQKNKIEMPISEEVYSVLFQGKNPLQAVSDLMTREQKQETI
jgi:glycerol-3-phosphate dehydrogenase (NAD(P)+)